MVSQGGAGGSVGALVYGLPHLALPQTAQSQIGVANRIHELGIGRRLDADEQTTDAIRAAANRLLSDNDYARRAEALAAEFELLPSPIDVLQTITQHPSLA
jgi:N-glycosyltransferase